MFAKHGLGARKDLALRLRLAREKAELTQAQLSELLGRPQTFISKIELAQRTLSFLDAVAICNALHVDITTLLPDRIEN